VSYDYYVRPAKVTTPFWVTLRHCLRTTWVVRSELESIPESRESGGHQRRNTAKRGDGTGTRIGSRRLIVELRIPVSTRRTSQSAALHTGTMRARLCGSTRDQAAATAAPAGCRRSLLPAPCRNPSTHPTTVTCRRSSTNGSARHSLACAPIVRSVAPLRESTTCRASSLRLPSPRSALDDGCRWHPVGAMVGAAQLTWECPSPASPAPWRFAAPRPPP
jgi:hypothetical protein